MKKVICIICLIGICLNHVAFAYSSASSLKYEIKSINSEIRKNEYKISKIKNSKKLSENEKKRQIYKLKSKNRKLQNEVSKLKYSYKKAIS